MPPARRIRNPVTMDDPARRHQQLQAELSQISLVLPGSLTDRTTRCLGFPSQRGEILLEERSSPVEETRRKFDQDFKEGAVRLVRETGKPVAQVARELGI